MDFTIPADTYNSNLATVITVDRNPQESSAIRVLSYAGDSSPVMQQRVDGINTRELEVAFVICCQTKEVFTLIDRYFRSLKGILPLTLQNDLTGGVSRQIAIKEWSLGFRNSIYGGIEARGKLCY